MILDHGSLTSPGPPRRSGSVVQNLLLGIVNPGGVAGGWLCPHLTLFRRALSSVAACGNKVDPVYETLRFGTSRLEDEEGAAQ